MQTRQEFGHSYLSVSVKASGTTAYNLVNFKRIQKSLKLHLFTNYLAVN